MRGKAVISKQESLSTTLSRSYIVFTLACIQGTLGENKPFVSFLALHDEICEKNKTVTKTVTVKPLIMSPL